jgi:GNAT superfamily N-acetyltransferase
METTGDTTARIELYQAKSDEDIKQVRELIEEYAAWLGVDLCFQGYAAELASLPGGYAPPYGRLFIAREGERIAGCIALRKIDSNTCEMKRLYVRDDFRGRGLAKRMVAELIEAAREIGYTRMRLDTLPRRMEPAQQLYRSFGFREMDPYYYNPIEGVLFMELELKT